MIDLTISTEEVARGFSRFINQYQLVRYALNDEVSRISNGVYSEEEEKEAVKRVDKLKEDMSVLENHLMVFGIDAEKVVGDQVRVTIYKPMRGEE